MTKYCPKCGSLPDILNEQQVGIIQFEVDKDGVVSEQGEILETDPNGVYGECLKCNHMWKIEGINQAFHYNDLP